MNEKDIGIRIREGESIASALRRFKKDTDRAGTLREFKNHEAFEKPSVKRRKKSSAARARILKAKRKETEFI